MTNFWRFSGPLEIQKHYHTRVFPASKPGPFIFPSPLLFKSYSSSKYPTSELANQRTLLGDNRISPPSLSSLYPFLNELDPFGGRRLGFVAFRNTATGGTFYTYTVRYWNVREEDGRNLRVVRVPGCWTRVGRSKGGMICLTGLWRNGA